MTLPMLLREAFPVNSNCTPIRNDNHRQWMSGAYSEIRARPAFLGRIVPVLRCPPTRTVRYRSVVSGQGPSEGARYFSNSASLLSASRT